MTDLKTALEEGTATNEMVLLRFGWSRAEDADGELVWLTSGGLLWPEPEDGYVWEDGPKEGQWQIIGPDVLANTDDALSLVPEGWFVLELMGYTGGEWRASLCPRHDTKGFDPVKDIKRATHKSLPVAILLAILEISKDGV